MVLARPGQHLAHPGDRRLPLIGLGGELVDLLEQGGLHEDGVGHAAAQGGHLVAEQVALLRRGGDGQDEEPVLDWIGLPDLPDGESQWFDRDGRPTKDEYYVPSRIRLDETCERTQLGATYLDAYDQVEVEPGAACGEELSRERRTFDWKVIGIDVPTTLTLDYSNPACCPAGKPPCAPPPDGPSYTCKPTASPGRYTCTFRALKVDRREVSGGTAATYWFALGVGKVLEDEKGEDREVLTCFSLPRQD